MLRPAAVALLSTFIATTTWAQDADLDGVLNAADAFPCDATVSAQAFAPAQDTHGMILVEDQWPAFGDEDTNDLVATYNYAFELDGLGRTHRLRLTVNVLALGGIFDNGLALALPIPRGDVASVALTVDSGAPVSLAPSMSDAELTVVLQQNLRALFGGASGQINSRADRPGLPGAMMVVEIALSTPRVLDPALAPYDIFLFRSDDPGHEIHRTGYAGSSAMRTSLFGTADDGSTPGRWFVDRQGLPAILLLPESTAYPKEGVSIASLFPDITAFASSGGVTNKDFYTSQVQASNRFVDVDGASAPAPRMPSITIDNACVTQGDADQDGYPAAVDCNDLNANVFPGNPEICDGLDNDCNQLIDDGVTGNFATYYRDADQDGYGDAGQSLSACGPPVGYVLGTGGCSNGSTQDCNTPGSTLIASSAWVDPNPPAGWRQCAGFVNTAGNDVTGRFLDNCLGQSGLRVIVTDAVTGQVEEDIYSTNLTPVSAWPSFSYLGGSILAATRTYWGTTTFFATVDGRDACGHNVSAVGQPTFGSGNGSRAIIIGDDTGPNEYRINCGGQSLTNRRVAIYLQDATAGVFTPDCDDSDGANFPNNTEVCDGQDNNCDAVVDEGLTRTFFYDGDGDGYGIASDTVVACTAPPSYVAGGTLCMNGSITDCNPAGTTLNPGAAFVDQNPPSGWKQCAGFVNTAGDDVDANFIDNCLNSASLRVIVTNQLTGQVEEDIYSTNLTPMSSWPSFSYLGGSITAAVRTNWGTTTFFATNDGRDACGHNLSTPGEPTFGSGNGSRAIVTGYGTGADEYRINCGGQSLVSRSVAMYVLDPGPTAAYDCNDSLATAFPGAPETCNGIDDDCDGVADQNNPGSGISCSTGLSGICSAGATQCVAGAIACQAVNGAPVEVCGDSVDNNCDGVVDELMCTNVSCSNGSALDCNPAGTTNLTSSRFVDFTPPSGWTQCAGFINTAGDDVTGRFIDNCLGSTRLRIIVTNLATGQVEEDIFSTNLSGFGSWPSFSYLGGSITALVRTNWGTTTFFATNDGRDACGQNLSVVGQPTFGSGNGSRAIVVGHGTNANEYRINCGGQSLVDRQIAIYR